MMTKKSLLHKKTAVTALAFLLLFALFAALAGVEAGAVSFYPDGDKTCNAVISFAFRDTDKDGKETSVAITGAKFSVYRVLQLNDDKDLSYTPVAGMEDVSYTFGDPLNQDAAHNQADAEAFYEKIQSAGIAPDYTGTTDADGNLTFQVTSDMFGVFLVVQTGSDGSGNAGEYEKVAPFLVQLPRQDTDGNWIYEDTISPKTQTAGKIPTPTPSPTTTPSSSTHSPKTGDESPIVLWALLLTVSAAGFVLAGRSLRKKKNS